MKYSLEDVTSLFALQGGVQTINPLKSGNINDTYLVLCKAKNGATLQYILQKINTYVFKNPVGVMDNIVKVTTFIKKKLADKYGSYERRVLDFVDTRDGRGYIDDDTLGFWRCYSYIDDVTAYNAIENPAHFYEAGRAFGEFQSLLSDFPADSIIETIPNFHNTIWRLQNFEASVEKDLAKRRESVLGEINTVLEHKAEASAIMSMLGSPELPLRVTHNDTKLNNVLIDNTTGKAICVIDLDTVMPGTSLYDFGDAVRYGANEVTEEERDISRVSFNLDLFERFTQGFVESTKGSLTPTEIRLMPVGAKLIAMELGSRFLADYLDGDLYFKASYPQHNLNRARVQLRLMQDIEAKMPLLNDIVAKYL